MPRVWAKLPNGKPIRFLIDTGSDRSYLTKDAFAKLQKDGATVGTDGTLTVDGLTIEGFSLTTLHFAHESDEYKDSIKDYAEGYLGMDFFSHYRLGLNLSKNELQLFPAEMEIGEVIRDWYGSPLTADGALPAGVYSSKISSRESGYCVTMDLDNVTLPMVMDTGSGESFLTAVALPYTEERTDAGSGSVIFSFNSAKPYRYDRYRFRWFGPSQMPIGAPARLGILNWKGIEGGILGRDAITPLRILIDYPHEQAYFADGTTRKSSTKPVHGGPRVRAKEGYIVIAYPDDGLVHLPPGSSYSVPAQFYELEYADGSHDLVPPAFPLPTDRGPKSPPPGAASPGHRWRWKAPEGWFEVPVA